MQGINAEPLTIQGTSISMCWWRVLTTLHLLKCPVYRHLQRLGEGWRVFGTWVCYFSIPVVQAEFHLLLPRFSECKSMKKKSCFQHSLSFPTPFSDGLGKIQSDVGKGVGKMKGELGNNNRSFANREVKAICFMAKYSPKKAAGYNF